MEHYASTLDGAQSKDVASFAVRHIYPYLKPNTPVLTITTDDVLAMYDELRKLGFKKVHKNGVTLFKSAFYAAIRPFNMNDNGRIKIGNPASGIKVPKGPKRRRSLTLAQYKALGEAREDMWTNQHMEGMYSDCAIWCLTYMGGRKGEIIKARREDVDLDFQFLTVKNHKTVDTIGIKYIPIPAPAADVLKQLPVKPGWDNWFFPRRKFDKPVVNIQKQYVKLKEAANKILEAKGEPLISMDVRGFTIHDLRKAFANIGLRQAKLMMEEVQSQLHHTDMQTTREYVDEDPDYTKQAHDKTAAVISGAMGTITFDPTKNNMAEKTKRRLFQKPSNQ